MDNKTTTDWQIEKRITEPWQISTRGSWWFNLLGGRNIPRGSMARSGCSWSTLPTARSPCGELKDTIVCLEIHGLRTYKAWQILPDIHTHLPGVELKSPQTNIGMSALTAIFSNPFRRVWTWKKHNYCCPEKLRWRRLLAHIMWWYQPPKASHLLGLDGHLYVYLPANWNH
jgi:hypothetical protein